MVKGMEKMRRLTNRGANAKKRGKSENKPKVEKPRRP